MEKARHHTNRFSGKIMMLLMYTSFSLARPCHADPEKARVKLAQLGKGYSAAAFVDSAREGDVLAVKLYLEAGMKVDAKEEFGSTPLMQAVLYGHTDVVKLLLANKANPNATNENGVTVLMLQAVSADPHPEVTKLLLDAGANPNPTDPKASTPLIAAAQEGQTSLMTLLIEKGAAVNATNSLGMTALTLAVKSDHTAAAALLLEHGAKSWFLDAKGMTPADYVSDRLFDMTTSTNAMVIALRSAGVKFATPRLMTTVSESGRRKDWHLSVE